MKINLKCNRLQITKYPAQTVITERLHFDDRIFTTTLHCAATLGRFPEFMRKLLLSDC